MGSVKLDKAMKITMTFTISFTMATVILWSSLDAEFRVVEAQAQEQVQGINPKIEYSNNIIQYALDTINEDRVTNNLMTVNFSENRAAQIHAENLLRTKELSPSHWTTDGMKPYMLYSKYNGTGYVEQNVAVRGYSSFEIQECEDEIILCDLIDPFKQIDDFEWNMINNDVLCCENRHKTNILDRYHTDVSLGISYDDYYFVLVQNFENNYIKFDKPLTQDNREIRILGNLLPGDYELDRIGIYYDKTPNKSFYEQHKADGSFSLGNLSALVVKPLHPFLDYKPSSNYTLIEASKWIQDGRSLDIVFDLSPVMKSPGVYTIVTYLKDSNEVIFPVTSYSIFV